MEPRDQHSGLIKIEQNDSNEGCIQEIKSNLKNEIDDEVHDVEVGSREQVDINPMQVMETEDSQHSNSTDYISPNSRQSDDLKCPTCKKCFQTSFFLNKHVMEDHCFNCKMCEDVFQNKILLEEHLVESHNIHNPQFSSRLIKFWSKQKDSHSIIVPYTCPVINPKPKDIASLALLAENTSECCGIDDEVSHELVERENSDFEVVGLTLSPRSLPEDTEFDEDPLRLDDLVQPTTEEAEDKTSIAKQPQVIQFRKTHPTCKRKCKGKGGHCRHKRKTENTIDTSEEKQAGKQKVESALSSGLPKLNNSEAETGQSVIYRSKGIDNDPFMRCFLKEVDIKEEIRERSEDSSDAEPQPEEINVQIKDCSLVGCLNTGNLLYVYPLVEIQTGFTEDEPLKEEFKGGNLSRGYVDSAGDVQVPKFEIFYHQPNDTAIQDISGMDTSQSSSSLDTESQTAQKVFIVSPLDREIGVSHTQDMHVNAEDSLWGRQTFINAVSEDPDIEIVSIPESLHNTISNGSNGSVKPVAVEDCDRCILCKRAFPGKTQLQKHMLSKHIDEYDNRCGICNKKFDTIFKVRSHVMMEHIDVQCKCCQRKFLRSTSLRKHMIKHSNHKFQSSIKKCEICLKCFRTATDLADHVQTAHPLFLKHQCDLCDKTFLTEDELFIHVDQDPHVCLLCSGYFESTLRLREHLLGHASDRQVLELFTRSELSAS